MFRQVLILPSQPLRYSVSCASTTSVFFPLQFYVWNDIFSSLLSGSGSFVRNKLIYMLKTVQTFTDLSLVELSHYAHLFAANRKRVARWNMVTLVRPNMSWTLRYRRISNSAPKHDGEESCLMNFVLPWNLGFWNMLRPNSVAVSYVL